MSPNERCLGLLAALLLLLAPDAIDAQLSPVGHLAFRSTGMYEGQALLVGGGIGLAVGERTRAELVGLGPVSPDTYGSLDFNVAYGGARLEQEALRTGRVSVALAFMGGLGWFWTKEQTTDSEERTGILVGEPETVVGFDLSSSVRIAATAGHRWVWGVEGDIPNRSNGDAGGFAFGAQLSMRQ